VGKAKLAPILRGQGFDVGEATVGRSLADLMRRGVVPWAPGSIRKVGPARQASKKRPHAIRKPKDGAFEKPATSSRSTHSLSPSHQASPSSTSTKQATAKNAARFLAKPKCRHPDGGSEAQWRRLAI
jgi:hypothetical protein